MNDQEQIYDKNHSDKLSALLNLYSSLLNDITFYQNSGNTLEYVAAIAAIAIPVLQYLNVNSMILSVICLLIPVVQIAGLQRGLESHTFVAMLRGYASYIEQEINSLLKDELFLYNSRLIDEYIAKQRIGKPEKHSIKYSMLITSLSQIIITALVVFFFYYINLFTANIWFLIICGIWFVACLIFTLKLCKDFIKKEDIRKNCPEKCKNMNIYFTEDYKKEKQ